MNIFQTFGRLAAIPESNMGLIQLDTVAGMSFSEQQNVVQLCTYIIRVVAKCWLSANFAGWEICDLQLDFDRQSLRKGQWTVFKLGTFIIIRYLNPIKIV